MAFDMKKFNTMMNEFLPLLIKDMMEKQDIERRLQAQLKGYEGYSKSQIEVQGNALQNALIEKLFGGAVTGSADTAYGPMGGLSNIMEAFPPDVRGTMPIDWSVIESKRPDIAEGTAALARLLKDQGDGFPPDINDLELVAKAFGSKLPASVVSDITERASQKASRGLTEKEQGLTKEQQKLFARQLTVQEKKAEAEGKAGDKVGGKEGPGADIMAQSDELRKELDSIMGVISKQMATAPTDKQQQRIDFIQGRLQQLNENLSASLNFDRPKLDAIVGKLRAGGAKKEVVEKYKNDLMKREGLTETEFAYILNAMRL